MNDQVKAEHFDKPALQLHARVYTAAAWPKHESPGPGVRWFFLLQCFEAMFFLCDRQGFEPEQVMYCGVIGKGKRKSHLWTAMTWQQ